MLLAGSGFALYQSPNNHTIVTTAPLARSGAAGGMLSSARLTGQTLGAVVLATIFTFAGGHGGHAEIVALAVAGCFAALAGRFRPPPVRPAPVPKPLTRPANGFNLELKSTQPKAHYLS